MKLSKYAKNIGVCYRTAWNHFHAGNISNAYRLPSGAIIVPDETQKQQERQDKDTNVCIYARVSSSQNKENLESQVTRLENYCNAKGFKIVRIVKEIGSGVNDKRKQFLSVIDKIEEYDLVVVEHKDRLTRFGFNYFDRIFPGKFHVVNMTEDKTEDLITDLIAIVTSFCARLYGQRKGKRKTEKLIKELQSAQE